MGQDWAKGPWFGDGEPDDEAIISIYKQDGTELADVLWSPGANETCRANARLIAAAPELYRYLELALGVLDRVNVAWGGEPAARAALAKARGESSK